jgi:hypothetical protein
MKRFVTHLLIGAVVVGIVAGAAAAWHAGASAAGSTQGSAPSCAQLPQRFDLSIASDAQLLAYGLPERAEVLEQLPRVSLDV